MAGMYRGHRGNAGPDHRTKPTFSIKEEKTHGDFYLLHAHFVLSGVDGGWNIFLRILSQHPGFLDLPSNPRAEPGLLVHVPCLPIPNHPCYPIGHYYTCGAVHGNLLHRHRTTKFQ